MSNIERLRLPQVEGVKISAGPLGVCMTGVLSIREPRQSIGAFFDALHGAVVADGLSCIEINIRELTFVNSSAIRLFVDWVGRISAMPEDQRYTLRFVTNRRITWQRTSLGVLRSLAPEHVEVITT